MTVFEHPLNQRIRAFLRLQELFNRLDHHLSGAARADLQAAVYVLLEVYDLTARTNLKTEVLKELERQNRSFQTHTEQNDEALNQQHTINDNIDALREELYEQPMRAYQLLQNNEFLNSIKHRCGMTSTGNTFDLPLYHFWLNQDVESCKNTILKWLQPYSHLREAIDFALSSIRNQGAYQEMQAEHGFYQSSLKVDKSLQLVRVVIPEAPDNYPEISAGIHRITIRFMKYIAVEQKPEQNLENVSFKVAFCGL